MNLQKLLFFFVLSLLLPGCIYIKSDYQAVSRYKLSRGAAAPATEKADCTLLVQSVLVGGEFDSEYLIYTTDDSQIQRFFYHRWVAEPSEMATQFLADRLLRSGAFSGGVTQSGSSVFPTHVLESRILEMIAHGAENSGQSYVSLKIQATLLSRRHNQDAKPIILQKTYSQKIQRTDSSPASIPVAMSVAFQNICDEMQSDIVHSLK